MIPIKLIEVSGKSYADVLRIQEELFNENIAAKAGNKTTDNYLILCEHQPVFTLGKSGKLENLLVQEGELQAEFHHINRGGDITWHGPGQLTVYPILDLDELHIGIAEYIFSLEESIIRSLLPYGLKGERIENAPGIWLRQNGPDRKIGAIGAHTSRHITMHGAAINIHPDLAWYDKIISCGITGKGVTSLQKELGREIDFKEYEEVFTRCFLEVFELSIS